MSQAFRKLSYAIATSEVKGIDRCPCVVPIRCEYWDVCNYFEVDCKNFRTWSVKGNDNTRSRKPDKYFDGSPYNGLCK